jgi:hypothetical protein
VDVIKIRLTKSRLIEEAGETRLEAGAILLGAGDLRGLEVYSRLQMLLNQTETLCFHPLLALEHVLFKPFSVYLGQVQLPQLRIQELIRIIDQIQHNIKVRARLYQVLYHRQ